MSQTRRSTYTRVSEWLRGGGRSWSEIHCCCLSSWLAPLCYLLPPPDPLIHLRRLSGLFVQLRHPGAAATVTLLWIKSEMKQVARVRQALWTFCLSLVCGWSVGGHQPDSGRFISSSPVLHKLLTIFSKSFTSSISPSQALDQIH